MLELLYWGLGLFIAGVGGIMLYDKYKDQAMQEFKKRTAPPPKPAAKARSTHKRTVEAPRNMDEFEIAMLQARANMAVMQGIITENMRFKSYEELDGFLKSKGL